MTEHQSAEAFVRARGGKILDTEATLSEADLAAAIERISGPEQRYNVKVIVAGIGGYLKVTVNMDVNGRDWFFEGDAGVTTIGAVGVYWGHCYTSDVASLTRDTHAFNVNAIGTFPLPAGYVNLNFFDRNSKLLGHLHGGGLAVLTYTGGGTGSWK